MRLLLLAGPGGGKGTQGARLAQRLDIRHIASGDLLREQIARDTDVGRRAREYVDRGELVPDDVILELVTPAVADAAQAGGYILDGLPRNLAQARVADEAWEARGIGFEAVVYLEVGDDELRRRLLARADIEGRSDDTPDVIANRLELFAQTTLPLVEHYRERGILISVDGARGPDEITRAILDRLAAQN
jgi:adenylate kinase